MTSSWTTRDRIIGIVSAIVAIVGLVMFVIAITTPVSFGWFASAEIPDEVLTSSSFFLLTPTGAIGAILLAIGLIGIAFALGTVRGAKRAGTGHAD